MPISRRDLLAAGAASLLPLPALAAATAKRPLRVAHMTDFHIQPELHAVEGSVKAWHHMMSLSRRPELVLVGGDMVMDAWSANRSRTQLQWDLYKKTLHDGTDLPIHHAIGNHDIWGIDKAKSHTSGDEGQWAKKWFMDAFGYSRTYHSFDHADWHFVMLDNVLLTPDGYNGFVDQEQLDWLKEDLSGTHKPTVVVSHIPLLSVTGLAGGYDAKSGEWNVGGTVMTKNVNAVMELFGQYPNVKLALSGHVHEVDRVDWRGVTYLCGGAVCGSWWKGPNNGFPPGYRVLDLHSDGTFQEQYIPWGWVQRD